MAFKYDPQMASACFPPGNYHATLTSVVEGTSRKGLPMLTLNFDVVDGERRRHVRGWITNPTSLFMLKELADALDQSAAFASAKFDPEQFVGYEVLVELRVIQTDMFGDQNNISHYHRANPGQPIKRSGTATQTDSTDGPFDVDEIPF
jgi:hypothetical protein